MPLLRLHLPLLLAVPQALLLACLLMLTSSSAFATAAVPGADAPVRLWNSGTCPYAQVGIYRECVYVRVCPCMCVFVYVIPLHTLFLFSYQHLTPFPPTHKQRVWLALLEKQVKFEHKIVDLQEKPADFTALYSTLHPDPEARAKVPILEHGKEIKLIESMVCLCVCVCMYICKYKYVLTDLTVHTHSHTHTHTHTQTMNTMYM